MSPKDKRELELASNNSLLVSDVRQMIEETRSMVATAVNAGLTVLYWNIGKRINEEILKGERAEYGEEIVANLSQTSNCRNMAMDFQLKNLRHMIQFAETFPDEQIVSALRRQLSWTHFMSLIYLDDPLKREFYAEMCRIERWSTRTLRKEWIRCCMSALLFLASRKK